jgi:uncharacterized protein YbjT (DUF2867 family)
MTTSKILITGAGGTVATAVAAELERLSPGTSRLAYHSADKAQAARARGRDAVRIDAACPDTLGPALAGIDVVFLLGAGGPGQEEREIALVSAAKAAGVQRLVKLSVWQAGREAYTIARTHRAVERFIERSGLASTFLRPNGFMQNIANHMAGSIRAESRFYQPAEQAEISHIDVRDVARVAAKALLDERHDGKAYDLSGPAALSYDAIAAVLSKVLGRPIAYVAVSDEAAKAAMLEAHMPASYADALVDLNRHYRTGAGSRVTNAVEEITGQAPLAFEAFAEDYSAALR